MLVREVSLVPFVTDIADQICPRYTICSFDKPWMGDWAKGLPDVGGIGNIPVGAEQNGSDPGGVGCVAEG